MSSKKTVTKSEKNSSDTEKAEEKKQKKLNAYTEKKAKSEKKSKAKSLKIKSQQRVLSEVRKLKKDLRSKKEKTFKKKEGTLLVTEFSPEEAHKHIHEWVRELWHQIEENGRPILEIPARTSDNIIFDEDANLLLLGEKTLKRSFHTLTSVADATRTMKVLKIIHDLLTQKTHTTKRGVYYQDPKLFNFDQKYSDKLIEDIAAALKTTRNSTNVIAAAAGACIGRLVIKDSGDKIDLTKLGKGGWAISPLLDEVEIVDSDAELIFVVEKDAARLRLAESKYWNQVPCIVISGRGAPSIANRAFLRRLVKELKIPAFALVDSDPYGHYIFSVYLRGSKRLSYESPFLATPALKLLGVLNRDLDYYDIPEEARIPMSKQDTERTKQLLEEDFVKKNTAWIEDLEGMLKSGQKAEIQAFEGFGFDYLTSTYLPQKLETGDWI